MIYSNYDIHLRYIHIYTYESNCKIYYDLNGNELENYASIYANID